MFKVNSKIFLARKTLVILRYDQILLKTPVTLSKKKKSQPRLGTGGPRPMYRSIYRLIYRSILDRYSTDTRSSTGRVSTDSPLNVGRRIDHDTISVNYRLYIGRLSVKSRSILYRNIDQVSTDTRSIQYKKFLSALLKGYSEVNLQMLKRRG